MKGLREFVKQRLEDRDVREAVKLRQRTIKKRRLKTKEWLDRKKNGLPGSLKPYVFDRSARAVAVLPVNP